MLTKLPAEQQQWLYNLAVRSSHPKSQALAHALESLPEPPSFVADLTTTEEAGRGIAATVRDRVSGSVAARLGSAAFVGLPTAQHDLDGADVFWAFAGRRPIGFCTRERLRPGAETELRALAKSGYVLSVLSGDRGPRVGRLVERFGSAVGGRARRLEPA